MSYFKLCKFCNRRPGDQSSLLIWGVDLCCKHCFLEKLKESKSQPVVPGIVSHGEEGKAMQVDQHEALSADAPITAEEVHE